jgi:hypothetical protein
MSPEGVTSNSSAIDGQRAIDPVVALSLAWIEAHAVTLACCFKQQQAEGEFLIGNGSGSGYFDARQAEEEAAARQNTLLERLAATSASSFAGVVAKLAIVVREAEDNSDLSDFPLPHIRSALADLRRLTDETIGDDTAALPRYDRSIGSLFEQPASSIAASCAFHAWSQGDDETYRTWTDTFRTLKGARQ